MSREKQTLIDELFRFVALLEHSGDFIFAPVWLTVKTYTVLYLISKGIDTSSLLLAGSYGSKPNMTKKLKFLEENGFISRSVDADDRRVFHFHLTKKSEEALREITPSYENALREVFRGIQASDIALVTKVVTKSSDTLTELLTAKKQCSDTEF